MISDKKITVNGIAAGVFETKMMKETLDTFRDVIMSGVPLKRIGTNSTCDLCIGGVSDISGVCIFLSSKVKLKCNCDCFRLVHGSQAP